MPLAPLGKERRPRDAHERLVRHGEHREIDRGVDQAARLVVVTSTPSRSKRRRMEPDSLDRGVLWLPAISTIGALGSASRSRWNWRKAKTIAALVGTHLDHPIHRGAEGMGDVGLALVDAGGGLPVVLPNAEMAVGDVSQFHIRNVTSPPD